MSSLTTDQSDRAKPQRSNTQHSETQNPDAQSLAAQGPGAPRSTTLRTQKVDLVASLLMALLIVVGMLVALLFAIWLTQTFTFEAGDIRIEQERVAGRGDHAEGFERDIEPPGAEEVEELAEPTLAESLQAVTEAVTSVAASLDSIDTNRMDNAYGSGRGDSRPPGPLGEGEDVIPRYERWQLKTATTGLKPYATQLDFYQIELAAIGGGISTVDYVTDVSTSPKSRSGSSEEENELGRLYFLPRQDSPLIKYDIQLLQQAGVPTQGRQVVKFIPKELEERLARTEMEYARSQGHQSVKEIAKTIFESQATSDGSYRFVVIEQRYRIPRE